MKNLVCVALVFFAHGLNAVNENWPFSVTSTERDLSAIASCVAAMSEKAPFLVDGDRPKEHSTVRILTGTLRGDAKLLFGYDGCEGDPYNFNLISHCDFRMFCDVDLETNRVVYLQASEGDYADPLVEYVNVEDHRFDFRDARWELRRKARNGEVIVRAYKQYKYDGSWTQVGNTRISCNTVVKFVRGWDRAIRESRDDG